MARAAPGPQPPLPLRPSSPAPSTASAFLPCRLPNLPSRLPPPPARSPLLFFALGPHEFCRPPAPCWRGCWTFGVDTQESASCVFGRLGLHDTAPRLHSGRPAESVLGSCVVTEQTWRGEQAWAGDAAAGPKDRQQVTDPATPRGGQSPHLRPEGNVHILLGKSSSVLPVIKRKLRLRAEAMCLRPHGASGLGAWTSLGKSKICALCLPDYPSPCLVPRSVS